jgi:hypothetical protein
MHSVLPGIRLRPVSGTPSWLRSCGVRPATRPRAVPKETSEKGSGSAITVGPGLATRIEPPICALIHVDWLVTADAPNGLIRIGQQLGRLKLQCKTRDFGPNGISCAVTPGL